MNILRVYLFGNMRLELNEQKVGTQVPRPVRKLLAYLLLHPNRTHLRDVLADLLWGESQPDKARGSFNTAVWHLRKVLEPKSIPSGTYLITNHSGEISFTMHSSDWLDVREFSSRASQIMACPIGQVRPDQVSHLVSALELYNGDLMEGFYDDWIIQEREHLRMLYLKTQSYLMEYYNKHAQVEESIACAQKITELDPLREEIHRELMHLFMANGQRSLAIRQYEICKELLCARKAFNQTNLRANDNRKNVSHTGNRFQKLHIGRQGNAYLHPFFHGSDLVLHTFQELHFLLQTVLCFHRQLLDHLVQLAGPLRGKDIALSG
jgi:DNA-binding SARP family transcriptional activator